MNKDCFSGAVIERGKITSISSGEYIVESIDRPGIVALPTTPISLETLSVNDIVYYFVNADGTGRIISKVEHSSGIVPDGSISHEKLNSDVPGYIRDQISAVTEFDLYPVSGSMSYVANEGPINTIKRAVENKLVPKGVPFSGYFLSGSYYFVAGYIYEAGNYGAGIIASWNNITLWRLNNGTWMAQPHLLGGIVSQTYSGTLANGALANLDCPSGVSLDDYYLPIIQGEYVSGQTVSSTAHSYTVQANGKVNFHLYVRDGTAIATGYISVRAFFVHK